MKRNDKSNNHRHIAGTARRAANGNHGLGSDNILQMVRKKGIVCNNGVAGEFQIFGTIAQFLQIIIKFLQISLII